MRGTGSVRGERVLSDVKSTYITFFQPGFSQRYTETGLDVS